MTQWHLKSKRKTTGAIRTSKRRSDKKKAWLGGDASATTISVDEKAKRETHSKRGKTLKAKLKAEKFVVVFDPKKAGEKAKKLEILAVEENNADRQFARRNVITKGAILKAKDGSKNVYVRVTSRPGQQGSISGIVLEGYEAQKEEKEKAKKKDKKQAKAPAKAKKAPKKGKKEDKGSEE